MNHAPAVVISAAGRSSAVLKRGARAPAASGQAATSHLAADQTVCVCTYVHMYIWVCLFMYLYRERYVCVYVLLLLVCGLNHMYVCIYIYIYIYVYMIRGAFACLQQDPLQSKAIQEIP